MPSLPIDPLSGPRYALEGKIVTMDAGFRVLERGIIYIDAGKIAAVKPAGESPPEGFKGCPLIRTGDTIYPGLIELHNHLSYNILPIWQVPKQYTNRSQWGRHPDYRKLISGPMGVLGRTKGYVEAIVRYVECKCLLGGVTTSQGIALFSNTGIRKYYRGIIRNVEETNDEALPEADTRISDVEAKDAAKFLERLQSSTCLLLHLSEGVDESAHQHFEALYLPDGTWAITSALSGIHSAALHAEDFQIMKEHGGSMIWSPLSNYLLYGDTADIKAAKEAGVLIGIGSDWSPSGSKNLLGELKVAHLVSQERGGVFTSRELLAMATTNAAKILKWDKAIGSIEAGKRADLLVLNGRKGDPYDHLINSRETSVTLVVINGVPRYGQKRLMKRFGDGGEEWTVGQSKRVLNLKQETADPIVGALTLRQACDRLGDGLQRLSELALEEENIAAALASGAIEPPTVETWSLELEHDDPAGTSQRPHLPLATGELTGMLEPMDLFTAALPLSELLKPVELDEITVEDDDEFFERLALQLNLPGFIKTGLPPLYGKKPVVPKSASFVEKANEAVRSQLETTTDLPTFLRMAGELTLEDRQLLVEQALLLLERAYVHLPLKRSMHAVDPIQRLKLLQYHLSQLSEGNLPPEIQFHNEMTDIFTSLRDLHTNYLLPAPFRDKVAYMPFLVEEYYQDGEPKYIVSKLIGGFKHRSFKPGVEILYWNGIPIRKAIEINADRQAGGNAAARFGRGLNALTVRPMVRMLPPDEEWVTITYRLDNGQELELKQDWLIFSPEPSGGINPDSGEERGVTALGFDLQTDVTNQSKKVLFAPRAVADEKKMAKAAGKRVKPLAATETTMPTVFYHKPVATKYGKFGYIRIFTFNVRDADEFVSEFVRLAKSLPQSGLIVDVRGNGGGLIYAAERLLQVLTPRHIAPERAQFITTPLVLDICRRHAPSALSPDFDLGPWIKSIEQAVETGSTYSRGYPITDEESCNEKGQEYQGPVLLITDALCYSATDIFAAGFQDHQIGPILGVHGNTGAGGANVWTHRLLRTLTGGAESPFKPLPNGAGMRVAIRQTLRVGERAGLPIEDLGVVPDEQHHMTKKDLLSSNEDLIEHAGKILSRMKRYTLSAKMESISDRELNFKVTTHNLSRIDVYLDWRPQQTLDVEDGTRQLRIKPSSTGAAELRLLGYDGEKLAAVFRQTFS
jgi:cytosine/adenosine deaminase-related metal-dependent hydrolase